MQLEQKNFLKSKSQKNAFRHKNTKCALNCNLVVTLEVHDIPYYVSEGGVFLLSN